MEAASQTRRYSPETGVSGLSDTRDGGEPPRRIWVVGPCGSGKSHIADVLAQRFGLPVVHLDEVHWNPGWVESEQEQELQIVGDLIERHAQGWVIEGNYGHIRETYGRTAELFIWLDLPFRITFPRLLYRCITRAFTREVICNDNRESLWETFCTKRSILLWAIRTHRWRRRTLAADLSGRAHVRLRSPHNIEHWLRQLRLR